MKKYRLILINLIIVLFLCGGCKSTSNKNVPEYDLSEDVAIRIGKIILQNEFPNELNEDTEFYAIYTEESWIIRDIIGNYLNENGVYVQMGGKYSIEIKRSNCEILKVEKSE